MYYSQFTLTSKLFQIIKRINRQPLHTENFVISLFTKVVDHFLS